MKLILPVKTVNNTNFHTPGVTTPCMYSNTLHCGSVTPGHTQVYVRETENINTLFSLPKETPKVTELKNNFNNGKYSRNSKSSKLIIRNANKYNYDYSYSYNCLLSKNEASTKGFK